MNLYAAAGFRRDLPADLLQPLAYNRKGNHILGGTLLMRRPNAVQTLALGFALLIFTKAPTLS